MQAMECYRHINKYTKKVINFQIENGRILKDDLKDWIKL